MTRERKDPDSANPTVRLSSVSWYGIAVLSMVLCLPFYPLRRCALDSQQLVLVLMLIKDSRGSNRTDTPHTNCISLSHNP